MRILYSFREPVRGSISVLPSRPRAEKNKKQKDFFPFCFFPFPFCFFPFPFCFFPFFLFPFCFFLFVSTRGNHEIRGSDVTIPHPASTSKPGNVEVLHKCAPNQRPIHFRIHDNIPPPHGMDDVGLAAVRRCTRGLLLS